MLHPRSKVLGGNLLQWDVANRPRITWTSTIILNYNVLSTAKFLEHSNNQQTLIFLPQKWVRTFAKDDYPTANIEKIREIPHWLDEENVGCPFFFVEIMFCTHNNVLWWNVRNIGCKAAYSRICKCCSSCFKQQITVVKLAILSPYRIINIKNVINVTFFIGKMCNLTWVRRKKSVKKVVGMEYF